MPDRISLAEADDEKEMAYDSIRQIKDNEGVAHNAKNRIVNSLTPTE
jgi:hypothetical protein